MVGRKTRTRSKGDRISQLPDHLICHILTHLSTKDVVRTSVISTIWRNLWQCVPQLDLNSREFRLFSGFVSFASMLFDFRKDSWIPKLCLSIHDVAGKSHLTSWIDVVTTRKIKHLDISLVSSSGYGDIPLSLYTCQTLVHLRLCRLAMVNAEFVSLPCVKILHLKYNYYPDEAILEKVILGSPVLEDLTIIRSLSENAKVLKVRSQTLKRIHINEFVHVVVDAPLLQYLKTSFHLTKNFTIINSGVIPAKVDIAFDCAHNAYDQNGVSKRREIRKILTDLSRIKELVISCLIWKDIFRNSESGPLLQFCNLSRLSAKFCYSDLEMLPNLLKSCPKLKSLTLKLVENRIYISGKKNNEPKVTFHTVVIPCVVSSLKLMELKSPILGYDGEMELVRYFLKNSTILEKLSVGLSGYFRKKKAKDAILKELLAMPRGSSTCVLLVV